MNAIVGVERIRNEITKPAIIKLIAEKLECNEATALEYMGNIVQAVRNAPEAIKQKLEACTTESFIACARQAIDLGLKIDHNQHGYLVPYNGRAQFQVGWRGYLHRLVSHNPTVVVQTGIVMAGDTFEVSIENGNASYKHIPVNPFESDYDKNAVGAFCFISYRLEGVPYSTVETLGIKEIHKMRNAAKTKTVWDAWFGEMIKKSAIRRASKIPFASVIGKLDEYDNQSYDKEKMNSPDRAAERLNKRFNPQVEVQEQSVSVYDMALASFNSAETPDDLTNAWVEFENDILKLEDQQQEELNAAYEARSESFSTEKP